jgi:cytochrome c
MHSSALPALLVAATVASALAQEGDVDRGRALAEERCVRCHAIGQSDESKLPNAPPFRTLEQHYPLESLEEAFAEGVVTGHPAMPQFQLSPEEIADLLSYIGALSEG